LAFAFAWAVCLPLSCLSQRGFGQAGAGVALPEIDPPAMTGDRQIVELPATVDEVDVGGGGRYLGLHFKTLRKIGIFDVNTLEIAGYLPANEDDTKFALGATKAVVVSGDRGVISRYDLATRERELTQTVDLGGAATLALFGSASAGPAFVSGGSSRGGYDGSAQVVDVQSLKVTPLSVKGNQRGFGPSANVRISANGNVMGIWASGVSPSGLQTLVKVGDNWEGHYEHDSVGYIVPAPDGRHIYTARGIFTNELRRVGQARGAAELAIPALHGPYYVSVSGVDVARSETGESVHLKMTGDNRPLVKISNLDPVFNEDDRWSRQQLTLDKRLILIPDATLIVQLASTNDKLIAVRLDIDEALEKSDFDYLIVSSRPPLQLKAGDVLQYQIDVKSKAGGVRYSLDSAPPGMALSDTGLLTWKTSGKSPARSEVIVTVSDGSGQQTFHTFSLTVAGGATGTAVPSSVAATGAPPESVETTPADLTAESVEVKLPGIISDVVIGANGRYLFLPIKDLKKIAAFDVSQAKVVGYLPASDDDTRIVAGATRALVFNLTQGVVSRYRLDTLEKDLTVAIPFSNPIQYIGMGAGSEGPVLLRWARGTGEIDSCFFAFLDVNTMRPIDVEWPRGRMPHSVFRDRNEIRVSTGGEAYVVSGVGLLRLSGTTIQSAGERSEYPGLPSADGKHFLVNGRILNESLQQIGDRSVNFGACVPSVTGDYFLSFSGGTSLHSIRSSQSTEMVSGKLYMFGDNRPLVTIPELMERSGLAPSHFGEMGIDKRVFFIPEAKVIATIPPTNDLVRLRKFDIDQALESSGVDYLIVDSRAPAVARPGTRYEYTISVKSKKGGKKFRLDAGPEGMTVSDAGEITWPVPAALEVAEHKVIVTVSDASGQSTFHTFTVSVPEIEEKLAAARRQAEEQMPRDVEDHPPIVDRAREQMMEAKRLAMERAKQGAAGRETVVAPGQAVQPTMRTWTDSTGAHTVTAKFVQIRDKSTVVLELPTGEKRHVPLSRLSNEDIYEAVRSDLRRLEAAGSQKASGSSPFVPTD